MNPFNLIMNFRVILSPGASGKVGEIAQAFKARRIMVVMDPGIERAGIQAQRPTDLDGRGKMLVASNMAGMAFTYSYLGLTHSLANPLTRVAGMIHGMAVGMMLPYVIRFNEPVARKDYSGIAARILGNQTPSDPKEATRKLAARLKTFLIPLGFPENLKEAGVSRDSIPEMAVEAVIQPSARANPREATLEDVTKLYSQAYEGEEIFG